MLTPLEPERKGLAITECVGYVGYVGCRPTPMKLPASRPLPSS